MKTITKQELINVLKDIKGTTFVSIDSETIPQLKGGKSCPFNGVKKYSHTNCTIGFKWENSVNNQLEREGKDRSFEAKPRTWGHRVVGTPLVEHKGKYYLETKVEKADSPDYFMNGNRISNDDIKPYIKETVSITDDPLFIRDYPIDSIRNIKIKGEEYLVV